MHGSWTVDLSMSFDVLKNSIRNICKTMWNSEIHRQRIKRSKVYTCTHRFSKKSLRFGGFPLPGVKSRDRRSHSPPSKARMEHLTWWDGRWASGHFASLIYVIYVIYIWCMYEPSSWWIWLKSLETLATNTYNTQYQPSRAFAPFAHGKTIRLMSRPTCGPQVPGYWTTVSKSKKIGRGGCRERMRETHRKDS